MFCDVFSFCFFLQSQCRFGVCSPLSAAGPVQHPGPAVLGLYDGRQGPPQVPWGSSTVSAWAKQWAGTPLPATTGPHRAPGKREAKCRETVIQHKSSLERKKSPLGFATLAFLQAPESCRWGGRWKPRLLPSRQPSPAASSPTRPPEHVGGCKPPRGHRPPATSPAGLRLLLGEHGERPGVRELLRRGPPPAPEAAACCVCCIAEKKGNFMISCSGSVCWSVGGGGGGKRPPPLPPGRGDSG